MSLPPKNPTHESPAGQTKGFYGNPRVSQFATDWRLNLKSRSPTPTSDNGNTAAGQLGVKSQSFGSVRDALRPPPPSSSSGGNSGTSYTPTLNRKKFNAALTAFQQPSPSPTMMGQKGFGLASPAEGQPPTVVKRNFSVGKSAKLKEAAMAAMHESSPTGRRGRRDSSRPEEIQNVMGQLKRVSVLPINIMSDLEELDWIGQQLEGDDELQDAFAEMMRQGLISSNLGPNRIHFISDAIEKVAKLEKSSTVSTEDKEVFSETLRQSLRKLTTTSSGAVQTIQEAIVRLRRVTSTDTAVKEEVKEVNSLLRAAVDSMRNGQITQFVQVFEKMETATPEQKVRMKQLVKKVDVDGMEKERAHLARERFSPQNASYLIEALAKLKRTKMNKRQADLATDYICREWKHVPSEEDEKTSDEGLHQLVKRIGSKRNSEILDALQSLQKVRLNDPEKAAVAEIVRSFGINRKPFRDVLAEAIQNLRKVQLTPFEAKAAAGLMFNLRHVKRDPKFDIQTSPKMINLKKVMKPDRVDAVTKVFSDLCKVDDLTDEEIDQLVKAVQNLGVEALDPTECQLIMTEYDADGRPVMVLNIPDGEDYANELNSSDISRFVKKKQNKTPARLFQFWIDLDADAGSDDDANPYDSDFEANSDEEYEGGKSRRNKDVPTEDPVPVPSIDPETPEESSRKIHTKSQNDSEEERSPTLSPYMDEKGRKIRYSKKPHWRYKKHMTTVVGEKRWRFEEDFDVDEVIYTPLTREQYERRKTVGEALKSVDIFAEGGGRDDDDDIKFK